MAWNEPGSGNSGNNNKDPWTGKPKPSTPPDLEQALRNLRKKFSQLWNTKGSRNTPPPAGANPPRTPIKINSVSIGIAIAILFLVWLLLGCFIIDPAEQAVIVRFGKYTDTVGPGPHWAPRFIDDVYITNVQNISTYTYSAQMLTEDKNLISASVNVFYRINDPKKYLFNVANPTLSLQQATASALRQVIGDTNLDVALTTGREKIRQQTQTLLTEILARYNTGLLITDLTLSSADAPQEVKDAFDDATRAQEDASSLINQAQSYATQVEFSAQGQAQRLLADAKGYQGQVSLRAKADTAQFLALLPKYQNAPNVTRDRMYLDTLEMVLSNTHKVFIDSNNNNNMFYLPLDKIIQADKTTMPSATTASAAPGIPFSAATTTVTANSNSLDTSVLARMQGGYSQ